MGTPQRKRLTYVEQDYMRELRNVTEQLVVMLEEVRLTDTDTMLPSRIRHAVKDVRAVLDTMAYLEKGKS